MFYVPGNAQSMTYTQSGCGGYAYLRNNQTGANICSHRGDCNEEHHGDEEIICSHRGQAEIATIEPE